MKNKGFTLIELLAVLSIMAVVAILIMPTMLNALWNGKKMLRKYDLEGVEDAGKMYITDIDLGEVDYIYDEDTEITLNEHTYKKGDTLTPYDFKAYVRMKDGIDVDMRKLVKEGYYDKNCRYKGEVIDGVTLDKDRDCHVPAECTLHVNIEQTLSEDGRYYITSGYTSEIKSGCDK